MLLGFYLRVRRVGADDVERLDPRRSRGRRKEDERRARSASSFDPRLSLPENRMNEEFVSWIESVGCGDIAREVGLIDETGKLP